MHPAPVSVPPRSAARRLRAEGRQVAIALPPTAGDDFNDVLLRDGTEAVAAIVQAALTTNADEDEPRTTEPTGRHLPIASNFEDR